jgi:hypothetical protein
MATPEEPKVIHYWTQGNMSVMTDKQGRLWACLDAATAPKYVMLGQLNTDSVRQALGIPV